MGRLSRTPAARLVLGGSLLLAHAGCGGALRASTPSRASTASTARGAAVETTSRNGAGPATSVPAATNDAPVLARAVVDLCRPVADCAFDESKGFTGECDGLERWEAEIDLFADGRADEALVWLLEHGCPPERSAAARKLASEGESFVDDAALARRILTVARSERCEAVGGDLGHVLTSIDLGTTGLEPGVLDLLGRRDNRALTRVLLEEIATHAEPTPGLERALQGATSDPRPDVRQAALAGLALTSSDAACPALERALGDADPAVALVAAHVVVTTDLCPSLVAPTLAFFGAAQRRGALRDAVAATSLADLCQRRSTARRDKVLAASLAEGFTGDELPTALREEALRAAVACDPDERRFVERFLADRDEWVRRMAKDVLREDERARRRKKRD